MTKKFTARFKLISINELTEFAEQLQPSVMVDNGDVTIHQGNHPEMGSLILINCASGSNIVIDIDKLEKAY